MQQQHSSQRPHKLKAFVAGATGYTGREVVRLLVERGVETIAHVRPDSGKLQQWQQTFGVMGATFDTTSWTAEAMNKTIAELQPDIVFSLLGTIRARMSKAKKEGRDPEAESYEAVDYGLTALLIDAASQVPDKPRFVYLSAAGVSPKSSSAYYAARAKAERKLEESGLPYTIARPSFITGPDRDDGRTFERIGASIIDAGLGVAGAFGAKNMRDRYQSTTNTILAAALIRLALDPAAAGMVAESEQLR